MPRLILPCLSFCILAALLLGTSPAFSVASAEPAVPTWTAPMPPNPRLDDKIKSGELRVPTLAQEEQTGVARSERVNAPAALTGQVKALAVLVDFSDKVRTVQATFFDSLIFGWPAPGRGSVRDYFNDVSYGQVDIITLHMPSSLGWRRAPQSYANYVAGANCIDGAYPYNCQKLAEDIVDAIASVVNFADYDNNHDGEMEPLMIVHAGPGAEFTGSVNDVWSHSWNLFYPRNYPGVRVRRYVIMPEYWLAATSTTSDMSIGVFAHEMGHGFWDLPDLYDTNGGSQGIGNWSLMAGGSWNGPADLCTGLGCYYSGRSPARPDAWSRIRMGFTTPTSLAGDALNQSIPEVGASSSNTVFKLANAVLSPGEYFLVENRQRTSGSYDEYLPGGGLAIWHIDEAMGGNSQQCIDEPHYLCGSTHYLVALEQADGVRDLEKNVNRGNSTDVFPAGSNSIWNGSSNPESSSWYSSTPTNVAVTGISASGPIMTANLLIGGGAQPAISIDNVSQNEGTGGTTPFVFTVSLSAPAQGTVSVDYATADGTATTAANDYTEAKGTLTFPAGQTSQTVTVAVNGDTAVESDETFFVNLSSPSGATIGGGQGLGTIRNDDQGPAISIDGVSQNEGNSGTTAFVFTVSLSAPAPGPVSVSWTAANGTATAGSDYAAGSGTVSFAAGESTKAVTVQVNGDTAVEPDETFFVNLSAPSGGTIAGGQGQGTIRNDDQGPAISINNVRKNEGRPGKKTQFAFTVSLSAPAQGMVSVSWATANGTATAGTDYAAGSGTLSFTQGGKTSKTLTVQVNGDGAPEPNETFYVNLSNPVGATIATPQGTGTILNDD